MERFGEKFPHFNENVMNSVEVFLVIDGVKWEESFILSKPEADATTVLLKSVGKILNERTEMEQEVTWVTEMTVASIQAIVTKDW